MNSVAGVNVRPQGGASRPEEVSPRAPLVAGELVTPEQVLLRFELATLGSRLSAVLVDTIVLLGMTLGVLAAMWVLDNIFGPWIHSAGILVIFALRNFYFIFMELRFSGQTLGKRATGIRVVAADGGSLSTGLVFARNLTRELEFLFPLAMVFSDVGVGGIPPIVIRIVAVSWILVMCFIPIRTRSKARLGDLVAGTLVVRVPRPALLRDLAERPSPQSATGPKTTDPDVPVFTQAQLDVYGIHELQVLEDVLRRPVGDVGYRLLDRLAETIQKRIGWESSRRHHSREFLSAFYAAQRGRLEKEMAFGRRRESKRDPGTE